MQSFNPMFELNLVQTCPGAPGNGKRLTITTIFLKTCDWSGDIFGASASPWFLTKRIGIHNTSRSLRSGVSCIQPGELTADVFEIALMEKHVICATPHLLLLLRTYNLHDIVIRHNTSPPWSACSSVLTYIYQYTCPGYVAFYKCVVCSV